MKKAAEKKAVAAKKPVAEAKPAAKKAGRPAKKDAVLQERTD